MVKTWTGIVVRNNLNETGTVPRSATSNSPDIIIVRDKPLQNPSELTDPKNYNNPYSYDLHIGWPNYLYVRGKNFTTGELKGTWNLFYATPNILLYPYLWQKNQLATSNGDMNPAFDIAAGAIGASTDAFSWVPSDTSDHYCMIAIAKTPEHGNPLEGVNNITDLASVLSTNANIAQRNVNIVRGDLPTVVATAAYDQGADGSTVDLSVVFKNLPKGSTWSISSGTLLNGEALYHSDPNTQSTDFKWAWTDLAIPAQWHTLFTYTLSFGTDWTGIPKDAHPSIIIRGELVQGSTDRLYHLGRDADPHPVTGKPRLDAQGGPVRVILVGSVSSLFPDVKPK